MKPARIGIILALVACGVCPSAPPRLEFAGTIGDVRGCGMQNLSLAVTSDGTMYLLMSSGRVSLFDENGRYLESRRAPLRWPVDDGYLVARGGRVFVGQWRRDYRWVVSPRRHGTEPGRFLRPSALAIDGRGCVYVGDAELRRLQVFAAEDTDEPLMTLTLPASPRAIGVSDENVAVAGEDGLLRLYRRDEETARLQASGRIGPSARAIAFDATGRPVVAFNGGPDRHFVRRFRVSGNALHRDIEIAPSYLGQWPNLLTEPTPLTTGPAGHIWFVAFNRGSLLSLDPSTDKVRERARGLDHPTCVAFDADGIACAAVRGGRIVQFKLTDDPAKPQPLGALGPLFNDPGTRLYDLLPEPGALLTRVVEQGYRKGWPALHFMRVTPDGKKSSFRDFGPLFAVRTRFAPWEAYYALERDAAGRILLGANPLKGVLALAPDGKTIWEASPKPQGGADTVVFDQFRDLALDQRGNVWCVDSARPQIVCLSPAGHVLTRYGRYGDIDDVSGLGFAHPSGIAITYVGDREFLYLADAGNQRLLKFEVRW